MATLPVQKTACVTLASSGHGFLQGICGQKMLLDKFMPGHDHVAIIEEGAYTQGQLDYLERIGWKLSILPPLRSETTKFAAARWPHTFTKLHLWNLKYDRVVYMDADAIPCLPYNELFDIEIDNLAATQTLNQPARFRSGMMAIAPSWDVFAMLMEVLALPAKENAAMLGDQGILNVAFGSYTQLPPHYHLVDWNQMVPNPRIVHIRPVPWGKGKRPSSQLPYVQRWKDAFAQCEKAWGKLP